jgi:hypothetical protein
MIKRLSFVSESLYEISNDNEVSVVDFTTSKRLIVNSIVFSSSIATPMNTIGLLTGRRTIRLITSEETKEGIQIL